MKWNVPGARVAGAGVERTACAWAGAECTPREAVRNPTSRTWLDPRPPKTLGPLGLVSLEPSQALAGRLSKGPAIPSLPWGRGLVEGRELGPSAWKEFRGQREAAGQASGRHAAAASGLRQQGRYRAVFRAASSLGVGAGVSQVWEPRTVSAQLRPPTPHLLGVCGKESHPLRRIGDKGACIGGLRPAPLSRPFRWACVTEAHTEI